MVQSDISNYKYTTMHSNTRLKRSSYRNYFRVAVQNNLSLNRVVVPISACQLFTISDFFFGNINIMILLLVQAFMHSQPASASCTVLKQLS